MALLVMGGLNWGLVAFTDKDALCHLKDRGTELPMEEFPRLVYFAVFLAAVHTLLKMIS